MVFELIYHMHWCTVENYSVGSSSALVWSSVADIVDWLFSKTRRLQSAYFTFCEAVHFRIAHAQVTTHVDVRHDEIAKTASSELPETNNEQKKISIPT